MTDIERGDLIAERDPKKREEIVNAMTEEEAKDMILRMLKIMHGEDRIEL